MSPKDVEAPPVSPDPLSDTNPPSVEEEVQSEEVGDSPVASQESATEAQPADESAAEPSLTLEDNAPPVSEDQDDSTKKSEDVEVTDKVAVEPLSSPDEQEQPDSETGDAATEEREEVTVLRRAMQDKSEIEGKIIGWNNGGFHVVVEGITAFCPRSEMELGAAKDPSEYLDKTLEFQVLRVQKKGRRVVLSRASLLRGERSRVRTEARDKLTAGGVVTGHVASLTDFGAFVDLGGVQGLVHVSEMSRQRIEHPSDLLKVGQEIEVKILKLEKGGRRISLSIRALEPDPWQAINERFAEGSVVIGKVEKTTSFGAFIELEPGLTGLLPAAAISLPRDASLARVYPPGKEVKVQIVSVDSRRQRISLTLEGSSLEGSRGDYQAYVRDRRQTEPTQGFNALADAFRKINTEEE